MKDDMIINKLLNIVVIIIMLGSSIILYNSVINYFTEQPTESDYKCGYNEETDSAIESELEADEKCGVTEEQLEVIQVNFRKSALSDIIKGIYSVIMSAGFLFILKKKNLLKSGLTTKILNAILLLIEFSGMITVGAILINSIFFELDWDNLFRLLGLVILPFVFYFVINKYFYKEKK